LEGLPEDEGAIGEPAIDEVLLGEGGPLRGKVGAGDAEILVHIAAGGGLNLNRALIEGRGCHPTEFIGAALGDLHGGPEDDVEFPPIAGDAHGGHDGHTGAIIAEVALDLDFLLVGAEKLGDATGLDERAGGALERQLDKWVLAVLVVHGLALGDAVHDAGLDDGAEHLHGAEGLVPLFLVNAPDLNEVAVVGE